MNDKAGKKETKKYRGEHQAFRGDIENLKKGIDVEESIRRIEEASRTGSSDASFFLGQLYEKGRYVRIDLEKSYYYYGDACSQGNIDACWKLAMDDRFDKLDCSYPFHSIISAYNTSIFQIVNRLEDAANQGNGKAAFFMGLLQNYLSDGDNEKRRQWLLKAIDLDYPQAMYQMGKDLIYDSEEWERDPRGVIDLFRVSAERCSDSAFELGKLYFHGIVFPEDSGEALKYFTISHNNGNEAARCWIDYLRHGNVNKTSNVRMYGEFKHIPEYDKGAKRFYADSYSLDDLSEWIILHDIIHDWRFSDVSMSEFENDLWEFENETFSLNTSIWGIREEFERKEHLPNFIFKPSGFDMVWGESISQNRRMSEKLSEDEVRAIWRICIESVRENIRESKNDGR